MYNLPILIMIALMLGIRHGFDLDHISVIDSFTRHLRGTYWAKRSGLLFSLGHGCIVTLVSTLVGSGLFCAQVPAWLQQFGNGVSIFFLLVLGFVTLWSIWRNPMQAPRMGGVKRFILPKIITEHRNPLGVVMTGALFAFSFDTFSQISLFAISAANLAGWAFSMVLGIIFMLGMILSDGLNGLLAFTFIRKADTISLTASRLMGMGIAAFSLVVAMINFIHWV